MKTDLFFNQNCPCCARRLQVPLEMLGELLSCPACGCDLIAADQIAAASLKSRRQTTLRMALNTTSMADRRLGA